MNELAQSLVLMAAYAMIGVVFISAACIVLGIILTVAKAARDAHGPEQGSSSEGGGGRQKFGDRYMSSRYRIERWLTFGGIAGVFLGLFALMMMAFSGR